MYWASCGRQILLAQNGLEGVRLVEQQSVDLVLIDVQVTEVDGFEATCQIRLLSDLAKSHLPSIAVTGHALK